MSTILVIDDSQGQRASVRAALEGARLFDRILEAEDGIRGLKLLLSESPDMVLCDLEMPGLDGEKLLKMNISAGQDGVPPDFLVLTAVADPERRAKLLGAGATDVIGKPFYAADLIARIEIHRNRAQSQRELIERNLELQKQSATDALTGLSNRRQIDAMLEREIARSLRYGQPFSVAMIDIDKFKEVNDRFGHAAGDRVLTGVAHTLIDIVRDTDCAGRYGGEEFLAILGNNDATGAAVFAERLRRAVAERSWEIGADEPISVTISVGVAEWPFDRDIDVPIVEYADQALYQAKAQGRNQVCCYVSEDNLGIASSSSRSDRSKDRSASESSDETSSASR